MGKRGKGRENRQNEKSGAREGGGDEGKGKNAGASLVPSFSLPSVPPALSFLSSQPPRALFSPLPIRQPTIRKMKEASAKVGAVQ